MKHSILLLAVFGTVSYTHLDVYKRQHNDVCIRIQRHHFVCKVGSTRCRVFARWFTDDIFVSQFRYLLLQRIDVLLIGNEVDILLRTNMLKALVGPLYQRTARA